MQAKYLTKKTAAGSIEAVKALDDKLIQLAVSMRYFMFFLLHEHNIRR